MLCVEGHHQIKLPETDSKCLLVKYRSILYRDKLKDGESEKETIFVETSLCKKKVFEKKLTQSLTVDE